MVPDQFKRTTTTGSSGTGAGTCETTISIDGGTVGDCYAINDKCNEFLKDKCISNIDVARKYNSNRSSMAPYCKLYSEIQPKYWNDNSDEYCGLKPESSDYRRLFIKYSNRRIKTRRNNRFIKEQCLFKHIQFRFI